MSEQDGTAKYGAENTGSTQSGKDLAGYDLEVPTEEKKEAEADCLKVMKLYAQEYKAADKGTAINVVLSEETLLAMQQKAALGGWPVEVNVAYTDLAHYESLDSFLRECEKGTAGDCIMYTIHIDGSLGRSKFIFDGQDMYLAASDALWNRSDEPVFSHMSYTRIDRWKYTEKGWFGYELCVPSPPEVTEIVDGSCMIRVLPFEEKLRRLSRQCVLSIGYGAGNLLDSDWDETHPDNLDFNSLYPYLYRMQYQQQIPDTYSSEGVPKQEFEQLMMQYLPVTAAQLQQMASFDAKTGTYTCEPAGCFTYTPDFLGTSLPEVTAVRENEDGSMTLTVDAVCDMVICDDAVLTHELTVKFDTDGSFCYLGNTVIKDEISIHNTELK